jgi:hypothetical protein
LERNGNQQSKLVCTCDNWFYQIDFKKNKVPSRWNMAFCPIRILCSCWNMKNIQRRMAGKGKKWPWDAFYYI